MIVLYDCVLFPDGEYRSVRLSDPVGLNCEIDKNYYIYARHNDAITYPIIFLSNNLTWQTRRTNYAAFEKLEHAEAYLKEAMCKLYVPDFDLGIS